MKPSWKVWRENVNRKSIEEWDIFEHGGFYKDYLEALKLYPTSKELFSKRMKQVAMYYFWSKCEHEVVITGWSNGKTNRKVDIYSQLLLNWDVFVDRIYEPQIQDV